MGRRLWPVVLGVLGFSLQGRAGEEASAGDLEPIKLTLQAEEPPSVYALPTPPTEEEGANTGGVNLDIKVSYLTDFIYRGVNRPAFIGDVTGDESTGSANFQFDGVLSFDLGKLPHPFLGIFANVLDSDPVTNFEETRPFFGASWRIRPFILAGGSNSYIFPDRGELNTAEVWGKITVDDSVLLRSQEPLLSPYIYGAYDYDLYNGWYIEAGVSHDFAIEGTGITLTALADIAYVHGHGAFAGPDGDDTGLHHYEFGLIGRYSLNTLLNVSQRYGHWTLNGYIFYSDGLDDTLRADTELWGGAGLQFTY